jgi:cytoskeletal protein CcmA (bactofilin family)
MKHSSHRKALQNIGSVLGTATRIEGTLWLEESVLIDGRVEGNLAQADGKDRWILIGPRAEVLKRLVQQARPAEVPSSRVEGAGR